MFAPKLLSMTLQKWIEYTDTDEKELAYFPATLPSDNGSAGTTETSCGDLD